MNFNLGFCFCMFLIFTLFRTCRGSSENRASTGHPEARILDVIQNFDVNSNDLNTVYIAGYSTAIKQRNDQIIKLNLMIKERQKQIAYYQKELRKCFLSWSSCVPFGSSSGIYQIYDPETIEPMNVLCNNEVAGSGWIVIKNRMNGEENFERSFTNYTQGFGSYHGDFFLGLEKIHRLTSSYPHELYIHVESGANSIAHSHYDKFEVAGKDNQYKLISLGDYSGNHTIDQGSNRMCRTECHGRWWLDDCGNCNFGGISWNILKDIKKILMLIRPKTA